MAIWDALPEANRGWLEVLAIVRFEDILDIDEIGDDYVKEPHLYAPFEPGRGPFRLYVDKLETIERFNSRTASPHAPEMTRTEIFPDKYRMANVP
jgi:hypothetical protein